MENPNALFVNSSEVQNRTNDKALQLHVARLVGFGIPSTIVSNSPEVIRRFFRQNNGRIVAKQHFPFAWRQSNGDLLQTGTLLVPGAALESDSTLSASPLIYQEVLDIVSEMRVTVFGKSVFGGLQIRSEKKTDGFEDIRLERQEIKGCAVPRDIREKCFQFMRHLNLSYAAFDIAIDRHGHHYFLEANESGQFLFLEKNDSEVHLLDAFCKFLVSGDRDFVYDEKCAISLEDYELSDDGKLFHAQNADYFKNHYAGTPFELQDV
jgi:glutathione synthase/RimK-type ligase-like ATP-grasp enzyme